MTIDVHVTSGSRAEDAAYRALADAAIAAANLETWRVVGGHMVNLHALRSTVPLILRATRDADLAVELVAIKNGGLLGQLRALGYDNPRSGNRFELSLPGGAATIDLLAPSYTTRHIANMDAGPIAVDGIPALHVALARDPLWLNVTALTTSGDPVEARVAIPDISSALAIKAFAYAQRLAPRDAEDIYRLLEVAYAEHTDHPWPTGPTFTQAAHLLVEHFDSPGRGLSSAAPDTLTRTRIRALVRAVIQSPRRPQ